MSYGVSQDSDNEPFENLKKEQERQYRDREYEIKQQDSD